MRIEYKKVVKVDELAYLIPTKAGATFSQLWQIFYYTRLFKYVHYSHYVLLKKSFNKICTYNKLQELCRLGYLKSPQHEVYCATNKVLPILEEAGFSINTLPIEPCGKGDSNELNNTRAFIEVTKWQHFSTLLYPQFGKPKPYLIPDALTVQLDKENRKYKLTFLEIEKKKPEWEQWIKNKKNNYLRLSKDIAFYHYWLEISKILQLPCPSMEKLKFSYKIIKM